MTTLVQYYAPTNPSDLEEKKKFYAQFDSTLFKILAGDLVVMMGALMS
jgi:hypothetical protein